MNLNHKNIVKYLGSFKTKTHLYIILEYVENGSLASIIKPNKFGPFPESLVAVYIAQVLEGLVYLHEQGVIHRDIKGANILSTKEGLVKLADFGVATKLTEADVNTHSVVGTPYWMAPEDFRIGYWGTPISNMKTLVGTYRDWVNPSKRSAVSSHTSDTFPYTRTLQKWSPATSNKPALG
ncbi:hypothetical protein AMTR_s00105p00070700 [Amborella trichopoda]|uniref:non-specific serine/threonine protein kinase n=1 Tax=Amborella trichopoda TaxID=13333 RepID=W1NXP0_AMBTC|nr:hypothetical protein AMTR_s00105p00070700 [Amborella trichopoda]